MKWLSVKKYFKPKESCFVNLLDLETRDAFIGIGYFSREENKWFSSFTNMPYRDKYKVTHFCIPDPIEIEEE
jgi:hypothetical protein